MDWMRPVSLTEFFLPLDDALSFSGYRDCLSAPELRWVHYNPMVESSQRRNDTAIQETINAAEGVLLSFECTLLCRVYYRSSVHNSPLDRGWMTNDPRGRGETAGEALCWWTG